VLKLLTGKLRATVNVSFSKIRGFLAVAQHLSFRRAADELGITQPALSGQIKALEENLGVQLLTRTTRQVRLTAHGERFILRARRLAEDFEAAVSEMRGSTDLQRGTVRFSCIPSIVAYVFPKLIYEFARQHPSINVEMIDDATVSMERRLLTREVEFGIGGPPRWADELEFTPVVEDPFVVICRADHPLASQRRVSAKRVLNYPIISLARGSNVRETLVAQFTTIGQSFSPAYELIHFYSLGALVEAGLGITLLPVMACEQIKSLSHLRTVRLNHPKFTRPIGLLKRVGETLSPAANSLYDLAMKRIKSAGTKTKGWAASRRSDDA
jgi:DNA-binding transcriptional LysR family regulator